MTSNHLIINADVGRHTINPNVYGHFAEHLGRCIYEGLWVGEDAKLAHTDGIRDDAVAALREIAPPVLRWPGGCFADEYHWRDGIGPRAQRPARINTHWGGVIEPNAFGTHEFFRLCELLDCAPYICGNVGSGTVAEMAQWVEYCVAAGQSSLAAERRGNGHEAPWELPYFGVGNESWGCGGNMTAEYYANEYKRYAQFVRAQVRAAAAAAASAPGAGGGTALIACGPHGSDYHWSEVLMREAGADCDGLALHYYYRPRGVRATEVDEEQWFRLMRDVLFMEQLIERHSLIMDKYDLDQRVALVVDEWGVWYEVEEGTNPRFLYQQNTLCDALVAASTLNVFNNHCDRVRMANLAQTVNVLQSVLLTDDAQVVRTPTFHVFEMFRPHQRATMLPIHIDSDDYQFDDQSLPAVNASASRGSGSGAVTLTICNVDPERNRRVTCELRGSQPKKQVAARILTGGELTAHNSFARPDTVRPEPFDGADWHGEQLAVELPPRAVVVIELS